MCKNNVYIFRFPPEDKIDIFVLALNKKFVEQLSQIILSSVTK